MAKFIIVQDDQYKAFVNADLICMFRVKEHKEPNEAEFTEVEVDFVGGSKTRLVGPPAENFWTAFKDMAARTARNSR
jgi:hypothetical protein